MNLPLWLLGGAALAALAILMAHRRGSRGRNALLFPSLQFVPGCAQSFRFFGSLEERRRLALRLLALALVAAGFAATLREAAPRVVAVVDDPATPGARQRADEVARELERAGEAVMRLSLAGTHPARPSITGGGEPAEARRRLAAEILTSAPLDQPALDRLRRAAALSADRTIVAGWLDRADFETGVRLPFEGVSVAVPQGPSTSFQITPLRPVDISFDERSPEARLWAAALAAESGAMLKEWDGIAAPRNGGRSVFVAGSTPDQGLAHAGAFVVVAAAASPETEPGDVDGLIYGSEFSRFVGREAEAAHFSVFLKLRADERTLAAAPEGQALVATGLLTGHRTVRVAGTASDLSRLLHEGSLGRLARFVLNALDPTLIANPAPRDDSSFSFARFGGVPYQSPRLRDRVSTLNWALLFFSLALVARLLDISRIPKGIGRPVDWFLFTAGALALLALAFDLRFSRSGVARPLVIVAARDMKDARSLASRLNAPLAGGADLVPTTDAGWSQEPSNLVTRAVSIVVASGANPPAVPSGRAVAGPILLASETELPRIVAVDAPIRVRTGEAIGIAVTMTAASREPLHLKLSDAGGLVSEIALPAGTGKRRVIRSLLIDTPLTAGVHPLRVTLKGAGASDARALTLEAVAAGAKRRALVLSATPSWDGRLVAERLANAFAVERWIRIGKTATLYRSQSGRPRESDPATLLGRLVAGDLVVLDAFGAGDLDSAAERSLSGALDKGVALLLVNTPEREFVPGPIFDKLPAHFTSIQLPDHPVEVAGDFDSSAVLQSVSFVGFPPASARLTEGAVVLAHLGGRGEKLIPWIAGRAVGASRAVRFLAPDIYRAGPARSRAILDSVLAWLMAPAGAAETGEPDEAIPEMRPQLRAAARASGVSYREVSSLDQVVNEIAHLPASPPRRVIVFSRHNPLAALLLFALIAANVVVRRLRAKEG